MQFLYPIGLMIAAATAVMAVSPAQQSPETGPHPAAQTFAPGGSRMAAQTATQTVSMREMAGPAPFDVASYVVPLNEAVSGHTQAWYANDWWQWLMAAPAGENPQDDSTGRACARDQGNAVWYLAGGLDQNHQRRKCTIPAGRHLFFPVTAVYDTTAASRPMTCDQARRSAAHVADTPVALQITVNGASVADPATYRIAPENCFDLTARIPAASKVAPMYPSATDGYWMMLRPLPPGRHVITFRAGVPDPKKPFGKLWQDITYDLTVLPAPGR